MEELKNQEFQQVKAWYQNGLCVFCGGQRKFLTKKCKSCNQSEKRQNELFNRITSENIKQKKQRSLQQANDWYQKGLCAFCGSQTKSTKPYYGRCESCLMPRSRCSECDSGEINSHSEATANVVRGSREYGMVVRPVTTTTTTITKDICSSCKCLWKTSTKVAKKVEEHCFYCERPASFNFLRTECLWCKAKI